MWHTAAVSRKHLKKAGSAAKRSRSRGKAAGGTPASSGGVMQGIVGGFRRVAGAERTKRGRFEVVLTVVLLAAAIAILFYRFGR